MTIACPCGVTFVRHVTAGEAIVDLAAFWANRMLYHSLDLRDGAFYFGTRDPFAAVAGSLFLFTEEHTGRRVADPPPE